MELTAYRWSSNKVEDQFSVTDPSTGETIAIVQGGGASEVDSAVREAHRAFSQDWRWRSGRERGAMLQECSRRLRQHADEIAQLEMRENGKPLAQARGDVEQAIVLFDYFGGVAGKIPGDFFNGGLVYGATLVEPYGVVAAIIPFNWPPNHAAGKLAPALAVGNTVVLKPPEQVPRTVMRVIEIVQEVVPPGVVHAVPGQGPTTGQALASHPLVRMISFTGAPTTGAAIIRAAADHHTPTLMELGGKNAMIVMPDADLDLTVKSLLEAAYFNQGEACTAGSRILVHRSLYGDLVARLGRAVSRLCVGPGSRPEVNIGPMVTRKQQQRVLDYIRIGTEEGANIFAQAPVPQEKELRHGFYVAPTLLTQVTRTMRVAREEIFGPVVCVIGFDETDEAIDIANDTEFGLTAAIFTRDHPLAMKIARRLDVGIVFLNNYFRGGLLGMPFGGTKASGYGREHTLETLKSYGRTKLISMPSGLGELPSWKGVADVGL